jgi:uncharacterized membrane protein
MTALEVFEERVQSARNLGDLDARALLRLRHAVEHEICVRLRAEQDVGELLDLLDAVEARLAFAGEGGERPTLSRRQRLAGERGRK